MVKSHVIITFVITSTLGKEQGGTKLQPEKHLTKSYLPRTVYDIIVKCFSEELLISGRGVERGEIIRHEHKQLCVGGYLNERLLILLILKLVRANRYCL